MQVNIFAGIDNNAERKYGNEVGHIIRGVKLGTLAGLQTTGLLIEFIQLFIF